MFGVLDLSGSPSSFGRAAHKDLTVARGKSKAPEIREESLARMDDTADPVTPK